MKKTKKGPLLALSLIGLLSVTACGGDSSNTLDNKGVDSEVESEAVQDFGIDLEERYSEDMINLIGGVVGDKAPDLNVQSLTGEEISLDDFNGKPFIVEVLSTTCPSCKVMTSISDEIMEETGLDIVQMYAGETSQEIKQLREEQGVDTNKNDRFTTRSNHMGYNLGIVPAVYFIDSEGVINHLHIGGLEKEQYMDDLKTLGILETD